MLSCVVKSLVVKPRVVKIFFLLSMVAVCFVAAGAALFKHWVNQPLAIFEDTLIRIQPGDSLSKVSHQLARQQQLSWPRLLILYARLTERTKVEVGEYRIAANTTPEQLLDIFQSGDVVTYSVTLVEGKTFRDFLRVLQQKNNLRHTLKDKTAQDFIALNQLDIDHVEGWFYPDTYQYVAGTSDNAILLRAHQKMQQVLEEEWRQRAANLPYKSPYEALIMASIIEKETGVAAERPEIAGVFVRRLKKGMRLQTDPTVIYGLGDQYQGNIRKKHLRQPTPYNTYTIDGLPPTPIAMPARAAIVAALHPADGNSLFFVGKGDGSHHFSATLREHNRAVRKYQIQQRAKNYRSSPSTPPL